MAKAVVALGSNLPGRFGSSEHLLEAALLALTDAGLRVTQASSVWRSAAWPDASAPEFSNSVAMLDTRLDPFEVMATLLEMERRFGRERTNTNAPRTLDLDLIDHDGRVLDGPLLVLPHPRAHERRFVMGPLAEIAPGWRHPVLGRDAAALAKEARIGRDARPVLPRCNIER